jgi:hypothetical protein
MKISLFIISTLISANVFGSECDTLISKILSFNYLEDIKDNQTIFYDSLLKETNIKHSIVLDSLILINYELDSILYKTTEHLQEGTKMGFSITLMRHLDTLYLEIVGGVSADDLFSYKVSKKKKGYLWGTNKIYGYFKYKDYDIYVAEYKQPNSPTQDDFNTFFEKTSIKKIIYEGKKEIPFAFENPMWVYQYLSGKLVLFKSVNDKGFFTNP